MWPRIGYCATCRRPLQGEQEPVAEDAEGDSWDEAPEERDGGLEAGLLTGLVAAGSLCLVGVLLLLGRWSQIGQVVGPSCTVGLSGTGTSISVHGWSAGQACAWLSTSAGVQTYKIANEPTQAVVCRHQFQGDLFTVHDTRAGRLDGDAVCSALVKDGAA